MPVKDLSELLNAGVINEDTAERIREYYKQKEIKSSGNKLSVVTGILGAIITGLGIILIIAHNWDDLSRTSKTLFAFLPLLIGQFLCIFTLLKKPANTGWRESSSAFLFFAVGASIALVSQIYNLPGSTGTFMLTWMLLCLPQVYVMNASVTSLIYIAGISYYAVITNYFYDSSGDDYYWLLLPAIFPHYYRLLKHKPASNFTILHNWVIPASLVICLGTAAGSNEEFMFIAYMSLFGLFHLFGNTSFFNQKKVFTNGYHITGALGTISLLLFLSFSSFWSVLFTEDDSFNFFTSSEMLAGTVLSVAALLLLIKQLKSRQITDLSPFDYTFLIFIIIFLIGIFSPVAVILVNLLILGIGLLIIRRGARLDHLGILNSGLLIIAILVLCRFFDTDLSFVIRGLMFVAVGAGFFIANNRIIKKRKANG